MKYPLASWVAALAGNDLSHAAMTSEDIVRSEQLGQQQLVNSSLLPKKSADSWRLLEQWGVKRLNDVDDLFCNAELPPGWELKASDHDMWSYLCDSDGLKRANVFYRAMRYNRCAHITVVENRYAVCRDWGEDGYDPNSIRYFVKDLGLGDVVRMFPAAKHAFLTENLEIIGAVFENRFYYNVKGESYSASYFSEDADSVNATVLSEDDFYSRYHHVKPYYEIIRATENLAITPAKTFLDTLPKGWESIPCDCP